MICLFQPVTLDHFWPVTPDMSLLTYHSRHGTLYLSLLTCHTWHFYHIISIYVRFIAIWNFWVTYLGITSKQIILYLRNIVPKEGGVSNLWLIVATLILIVYWFIKLKQIILNPLNDERNLKTHPNTMIHHLKILKILKSKPPAGTKSLCWVPHVMSGLDW